VNEYTEAEEKLAEMMFGAYNDEGPNPWQTHDGREVPQWSQLGEQVQGKWFAAARCAREQLTNAKPEQASAEDPSRTSASYVP
jgi:hypothetical protein